METQNSLLQKSDSLLIIDVHKDLSPGGAMAIEGGDRIIPVLNHWHRPGWIPRLSSAFLYEALISKENTGPHS